jgi:hypothetical protein
MDRTSELTDAFVEVKFADLESKRTPIFRKSLNPIWNEDFRFEVVEDSDLQNEPLEIKIMDYDQITYNDAIGTVFIDLNPLLTMDSNAQVSGWFPIYDTLQGIRGELNAQIKLQFFGNINPFKDSSAGVQFYSSPLIPLGYQVVQVLGFVSALENQDDPEYHWTDSFRTPRKSNEARTRVMYQLAGNIRRILGKKVLDMTGNAVLGVKQYFDFETERKDILVRAIGTAVKLVKVDSKAIIGNIPYSPQISARESSGFVSPTMLPLQERGLSSEAMIREGDELDELPQPMMALPSRSYDPILLTINRYPEYSIIGTGGFVCAASIKILDNDDREVRDAWWNEIREEVKSHAKTLGCTHVIGYTEQSSIDDEVIFLYCSGTAVNLDLSILQLPIGSMEQELPLESQPESPKYESPQDINESIQISSMPLIQDPASIEPPEIGNKKRPSNLLLKLGCRSCHITYKQSESPFPMALTKCGCCSKKYVPEVYLTTSLPPPELETIGDWVLMEAHGINFFNQKFADQRKQKLEKQEVLPLVSRFHLRNMIFIGKLYTS